MGGTGFIGPDVVRALAQAGADVTVFHSGAHEVPDTAHVPHVHADRASLRGRIGDPEAVVDMASMTQRDAEQTAAALRGTGARLVSVSSADVYRAYGALRRVEPGPPLPLPIDENAPLRTVLHADRDAQPHDPRAGLDPTAYDKILVERTFRAEPSLRVTILRLGFVFGPRSYRHYAYVRRMLDARPAIPLLARWAEWRGTHAYSENAAAAIALVALNGRAAGRTYNVGEAAPRSMRNVISRFAEALGWTGRIVAADEDRLPAYLVPRLDLRHELVLDTSALREELGYREHVDARIAFARTAEWMRAHPPAPDHPTIAELDYAAEDRALAALGRGC